MSLKKIYNGHYRRVPSSGSEKTQSLSSETDTSKEKMASEQSAYEPREEKKVGYNIWDNVIYGAGLGIGAVGLAIALVSSTMLASTLVLSTYLCVNNCTSSTAEEEIVETRYF